MALQDVSHSVKSFTIMQNISNVIPAIFETHKLALESVLGYSKKRFGFEDIITSKGNHFIGIIGPRGAGKSVCLKQLSKETPQSLYISLDTLPDPVFLYDLIKTLSKDYQVQHFFLDEVHVIKSIYQELKKIYDFLPIKITFTSSVALAMVQAEYDLSRRIQLKVIGPFSFREYVYFKENIVLTKLSLEDILQKKWQLEHHHFGSLFPSFLQGGNLPFSLDEPNPLPILENIVQKVIHHDIPMIAKLQVDELEKIKKLLKFIGKSSVDGINYSSLSTNLGITKYKAEQYVQLLSDAFILYPLLPKGTAVLKEPKVLMQLPYRLLYQNFEDALGGLREDMVVSHLTGAGYTVSYLKGLRGEKTPDFWVESMKSTFVIEVGGKGKSRSQFKGIKVENKLIFSDHLHPETLHFPLYLCGFLI